MQHTFGAVSGPLKPAVRNGAYGEVTFVTAQCGNATHGNEIASVAVQCANATRCEPASACNTHACEPAFCLLRKPRVWANQWPQGACQARCQAHVRAPLAF